MWWLALNLVCVWKLRLFEEFIHKT
jgi:hypothetical protein